MAFRNRRLLGILVFLTVLTGGAGAVYVGSVIRRATGLWWFVQDPPKFWSRYIWAADPELGHVHVPSARSALIFREIPPIPAATDAYGFRIPVDRPSLHGTGPTVLALGDSCTFGSMMRAEDAYAYRFTEAIDGTLYNAAVGSYGLAQMALWAERVIPACRPNVVLVQYSPWLVSRAQRYYAQTYFGLVPSPYFTQDGRTGAVRIAPPAFTAVVYDLPIREFVQSERSARDFLRRVGIPLLMHDDFYRSQTWVRRKLGSVPAPLDDRELLVREGYGRILRVCEQIGAEAFIVRMDHPADRTPLEDVVGLAGFPVVDAEAVLWGALEVPTPIAFRRAYEHWHNGTVLDSHPNDREHDLIAKALLAAYRNGVSAVDLDGSPS